LADEWALYDPLPNGELCWAVSWEDENRHGWWTQHGNNQEARRFFPHSAAPHPFPPVIPPDMVRWMRESHTHLPCEPKKIVHNLAYILKGLGRG